MPAKPIVAATDGSEESLRAVDWAAREAVLRGDSSEPSVAATMGFAGMLVLLAGPGRAGLHSHIMIVPRLE